MSRYRRRSDSAVYWGFGVFVVCVVASIVWAALVTWPSWKRAHDECSQAGANAAVIQQKDFLNPYVCLKVNPGVQP